MIPTFAEVIAWWRRDDNPSGATDEQRAAIIAELERIQASR